jgi:hypothetical protein
MSGECGQQVFPDRPEWGDIRCNRKAGHAPPHARFDVPDEIWNQDE